MKNIFVNKNHQIRSGWKIAMVVVMALILTIIVSILIGIIYTIATLVSGIMANDPGFANKMARGIEANPIFKYITQLLSPIAFLISTFFVLKVIDKKKAADIGFNGIRANYRDFIWGLGLGAVSMTIIFFTMYLSRNIALVNDFSKPDFSWSIVTGLILFIAVGFSEEIFSRGYCMMVLNQTGIKWVPVVVSSVIFSLLHSLNPNVTVMGLINILLVGVLFACMYLRTGNLWMPIGYHITWNYFQGNIFGFPVSGLSPEGIFNVKILNHNIITGGQFGPEGGIIATLLIIAGFVVVWKYPNAVSTRSTVSN